jgi:hypothetical protein
VIFHWKTGETFELRPGAKARGIHKAGHRPDILELSYEDLQVLLSSKDKLPQLLHMYCVALARSTPFGYVESKREGGLVHPDDIL